MAEDAVDLEIRQGEAGDLEQILDIYNYYVAETHVTFDVDPYTVETRRPWFDQFAPAGPHRLLVATRSGRLEGYVQSTAHRAKGGYATTIETGVYVRAGSGRRGTGSALYGALFEALRGEDVRLALAGLAQPNPASLALHRRFGFEEVGTFRAVGRKFGRFVDVAWMQKALNGG